MLLLPIALFAFVTMTAILLTTSPRIPRWTVLGAASLGMAVPWFMPRDAPALRAAAALAGLLVLVRSVELVRAPREWSARRRLWHLVSYADTRRAPPAPPEIAWALLVRSAAYAVPTALSYYLLAAVSPRLDGATRLVLRWVGGLVFVYCLTDMVFTLAQAGYRLAGFAAPPLHRTPVASRSLQEFWGERWNRTVSAWLRQYCFVPLARRGRARAGAIASFVVSGLLHAYLVLVSIGATMAGWMLGFFLVQPLLVIVEHRLGVSRWRPLAAQGWVLAAMLVSSPLFVEPFLGIVLPTQ